MATCADCGASYAESSDDCQRRFHALLALDHSRREPWGSRHALAFATFVLQHAGRYERQVLEAAWALLVSVYVQGRSLPSVIIGMRKAEGRVSEWAVPSLPPGAPAPRFITTIADLGSFAADRYPEQLDDWCRATLTTWQAGPA